MFLPKCLVPLQVLDLYHFEDTFKRMDWTLDGINNLAYSTTFVPYANAKWDSLVASSGEVLLDQSMLGIFLVYSPCLSLIHHCVPHKIYLFAFSAALLVFIVKLSSIIRDNLICNSEVVDDAL